MNVYVRELVSSLAQAGVASDVYTRRWADHLPEVVEVEPGFRVVHVPAGAADLPKELLPEIVDGFTDGVLHHLTAGTDMAINEHIPEPTNPLGLDGIEFVEYATTQPQALGAVLQAMGFMPVARHRSREVMLYRQGTMNLIVNAHPEALPGLEAPTSVPALSAMALRVRDAAYAWLNYTLQPDVFYLMLQDFPYTMPSKAALDYAKAAQPELYQQYIDSPITNTPADVISSGKLFTDVGDATPIYDRIWTEVKGEQ